jgi:hypothetical protein
MKPILIALIVVIVGIVMYSEGSKDRAHLDSFEKDGVTVKGEIQGGESHRTGRRGRSYNLKITYLTAEGRQFNKDFSVSSSFFKNVGAEGIITNPDVEVVYLKQNPGDAMVKGGSNYSPEFRYLGPFLSLGALGYLGLRVRKTLVS